MDYFKYALPLFSIFLTICVLSSTENIRRKIFLSLAAWIPIWGPIIVLSSLTQLPTVIRLVIAIAINAMIAFVMLVFAGAGAGNSNQAEFFVKNFLPIEIGLFIALCLISFALMVYGRTKWAIGLPFATLPTLVAGAFIASMLKH